jgi:hypothetical protein
MRAFWGSMDLRTTLALGTRLLKCGGGYFGAAGTSTGPRLPVELSSAWEKGGDARGCSLLDRKMPFLEKRTTWSRLFLCLVVNTFSE